MVLLPGVIRSIKDTNKYFNRLFFIDNNEKTCNPYGIIQTSSFLGTIYRLNRLRTYKIMIFRVKSACNGLQWQWLRTAINPTFKGL
jgi:hypothetical protein